MKSRDPDAHEVMQGARQLVDVTVLKALIDHASEGNLALRERIVATIDRYLEDLNPQSELEHAFANKARRYATYLLQPA